jgi:drug/metabolite transporter superfamily protein YnfA
MEQFGWLALTVLVLLSAALLEVGGDAVVRQGLRGGHVLLIVVGGVVLAGYGLMVNALRWWDFSKLLGVYVAVFAVVSVLWGRFLFKEDVPVSSWAGLALIVAGGLVIYFGRK